GEDTVSGPERQQQDRDRHVQRVADHVYDRELERLLPDGPPALVRKGPLPVPHKSVHHGESEREAAGNKDAPREPEEEVEDGETEGETARAHDTIAEKPH